MTLRQLGCFGVLREQVAEFQIPAKSPKYLFTVRLLRLSNVPNSMQIHRFIQSILISDINNTETDLPHFVIASVSLIISNVQLLFKSVLVYRVRSSVNQYIRKCILLQKMQLTMSCLSRLYILFAVSVITHERFQLSLSNFTRGFRRTKVRLLMFFLTV